MHKLFSIVFIILVVFSCIIGGDSVLAEGESYARIITNDTYLYATATNAIPLFALENTYYVTIKETVGNYYRVEVADNTGVFNKISGYVEVSKVELCTATPVTPLYPTQVVKVIGDSAKLHLHPDKSSRVLIRATYSQPLGYYGTIIVEGTSYYYVSCGDYMGYVDSINIEKAIISPHPTPLKEVVIVPEQPISDPNENPPNTDTPVKDPTITQDFDGAQLALILLITIPSVVIVFLLFSPNKGEKHTSVATVSKKDGKPRYFDDYL